MRIVGWDLETTGLDPTTDRIISAAFYTLAQPGEGDLYGGDADGWPRAFCDVDNEQAILKWIIEWARYREPKSLVGWNSESFDIPFLARRLERHGLLDRSGLRAVPNGLVGKYGDARWSAAWAGHVLVDAAYPYQRIAEREGIGWGLKTVAQSRGIDLVVEDAATLTDLDPERITAYNVSDARATALLWRDITDGTTEPPPPPAAVPTVDELEAEAYRAALVELRLRHDREFAATYADERRHRGLA